MEDFFKNVADAGFPRAVLFPAGYKGWLSTKQSTVRDQTSYPLQNIQKGQCFLHNDGQVIFSKIPMAV